MASATPRFLNGPGQPFDAPPKPGMTLSHSVGRTLAPAAAAEIKRELHERVYVANTDAFLECILHIEPEIVASVFEQVKLTSKGIYKQRQWAGLKLNGGLEKSYYKPFIKVCNSIRDAVDKLELSSASPDAVRMKWIDSHSHTINSQNKRAAEIRPDCVLATDSKELEDYKARLKKLEREIGKIATRSESELQTSSGKRTRSSEQKASEEKSKENEHLKKLKQKRDELTRICALWWMRVHVPTEVKGVGGEKKYSEAVQQLFRYIRQMFRDQLDRRFVLGIVLVKSKLTVWISDRSGAIGMQTPIDIHKEPKKFIQVIAALHMLPPNRLGWDITMKLYDGSKPIPSYTQLFDITKPVPDIYTFNWVISMPVGTVSESSSASHEDYITVSVLSIAQAEVMCGRATIAFVVIPYEQRHSPHDRTFFVLKQSYRPAMPIRDKDSIAGPTKEADFYQDVDHPHVAKLIASGDVIIDGMADSTKHSMRRGLRHISDSDVLVHKPQMATQLRPDDEESLAHILMSKIIPDIATVSAKAPYERIFTRVILEGVGFGAKLFLNKWELIRTFKGVIEGHKYLYQERQVLQRDCSLSNMLIRISNEGIDADTQGSIIDLDHAKKGLKVNVQPCHIPGSISDDGISGGFEDDIQPLYKKGLTKELVDNMYTMISLNKYVFSPDIDVKESDDALTDLAIMMRTYVRDRQAMLGSQTRGQAALKDLNWEVPTSVISFSQHKPRSDLRTGTLPFMATQILTNQMDGSSAFYQWGIDAVVHDAPHDMESVFWCLLYLCLTRKSSGGARRDELQEGNRDPDIRRIVYCLFDGDDIVLKDNKALLFKRPSEMEYILKFVDPSFDDFKPLLRAWWNILILAFRYRAFEYWNIHDMFLKAIEDLELELGPQSEELDQAEESERQRRMKFFEKITTALVKAHDSTMTDEAQDSTMAVEAQDSTMAVEAQDSTAAVKKDSRAPQTPPRRTNPHAVLDPTLTPRDDFPLSNTLRAAQPDSPTPRQKQRKTR